MRGWSLAAVALLGCQPQRPSPVRPVPVVPEEKREPIEPATSIAPTEPSEPAPKPKVGGVRNFDDQPVFVGGGVAAGPGLAAWAKVGQTLHLISPNGERWQHQLTAVMHDGCEAKAPLDTCAFIGFDAAPQDIGGRSPWRFVHIAPNRVDVDDPVLRPAFLASINAPPPAIVLETFRVRYHNALCEDGEDAENRVLMTTTNSTGNDPLGKASVLGKRRQLPRRTLSVDVDGATLHFAYISAITMPSDRTMLSLDRDRTEWLWVAREDKGHFTVLLDQQREVRRGFDHDLACQLPVAAPVPFALRHEPAGLTVYTHAPLGVQRWHIQDDAMTLDATFEVTLHEAG